MGLSEDVATAAQLVALHPGWFGGIWLEGGDEEAVVAALPAGGWRKLPVSIDEERLTGGLDVAATLSAGKPVMRPGLLAEAAGSILVVPGAERLTAGVAGRIATAMDGGGPALVLLDRSDGEQRPPHCLTERVAFHLYDGDVPDAATTSEALSDEEAQRAIAGACVMLGINSARADLFAWRAARAHVASRDGAAIDQAALAFAARTVLAPRATRLPVDEPEAEQSQPQKQKQQGVDRLEDVVLEAVRAALPADLLASLLAAETLRRRSQTQGAGARRTALQRSRTIGAQRGRPGGGARLAILDTLRAAAPWQRLRGRTERVLLARDDLRIRRHESKSATLTVFAVDASGSAAAQRLAEAKGAVEALLQQSYVRRAEVALIAIRGSGATLLLPPTRSLTRARRLLAELPGGGGTPLAAGIDAARAMAEAAPARGRTPALVVLTDGRANVALDGTHGRDAGMADAAAAAMRVAAAGLKALVIDIGPRARSEASDLARGMAARYLHLPLADQGAVGRAVLAGTA